MIDFSTLQGLIIPEGAVTQIADASGKVIWKLANDKPIILEVEKITSDTYAGETTYTGEQFILLDIYPKTNGTVSVTYGGITKTITDTSGVEEPNAQQVFFGTFNGVSDSVSTPASGTLIIEGDYYAFGCGSFQASSKGFSNTLYRGIIGTVDVGNSTMIPTQAFGAGAYGCEKMTAVNISDTVKTIKNWAFASCTGLTSIYIVAGVESIESGNVFDGCYKADIIVDSRNKYYSADGGALFNKNKTTLIAYPAVGEAYTVPSTVTEIGEYAFYELDYTRGINYTITVPTSVTNIGRCAFKFSGGGGQLKVRVKMLSTTPPTLGSSAFYDSTGYHEIIVPKGSGAAYKEAEEWSNYAAFITESS